MQCATKYLQKRYRSKQLHLKLQEIMVVLETAMRWRGRETLVSAIDDDWRWIDIDMGNWGVTLSNRLYTILLTFRSINPDFHIEKIGNNFMRLEYKGE